MDLLNVIDNEIKRLQQLIDLGLFIIWAKTQIVMLEDARRVLVAQVIPIKAIA